ncbi:MAG TPA: RsmB/NOP family class I SAM-dependent RNA methyltransferase [Sphingobium sp.]|nr:RsmB/NOP family class I SAM-dependent RNA methyltransferase [Sphingobium sp.]
MTPAARVQAAIELLDLIIAAARDDGAAADTLIARYFKDRRYAGSKDRRAVRELVYRAIRRHGERPDSGRAAMLGLAGEDAALATLFDGSPHGPAPIQPDELAAPASLLPAWLAPELAAPVDAAEQAALLSRAPLHLRINALKARRDDLIGHWPDAEPLAHLPHGLALPAGTDVERDPLLQAGQIEVQDGGSQHIARACAARPGMTVLDLCAGGGGKTLALAAEMAGQGRLIATDTARDRLARLTPRAQRAGADGLIETLLLDPGREAERLAPFAGQCDVVLVDAPCSGAGTWRRNPEARWRLTSARLDRVAALQAHLLAVAAPLVKPGGRLVYAVCSLFDREGRGQIERFASAHPSWKALRESPVGRPWGEGTLLTPYRDGTDGFFFAALEKPC